MVQPYCRKAVSTEDVQGCRKPVGLLGIQGCTSSRDVESADATRREGQPHRRARGRPLSYVDPHPDQTDGQDEGRCPQGADPALRVLGSSVQQPTSEMGKE